MLPAPEANDFYSEFLEDYFAECEEHLVTVRSQLLALESWVRQPQIQPEILNLLFRSFHTLKGLSGMVGVQAAEELAHQMESYLRSLRDEGTLLSSEGFEALLSGTKFLEQAIINAHDHQPAPDIHGVLSALEAVIPQKPPAPLGNTLTQIQLKESEQQHLQTQIAEGNTAWHFIFASQTELHQRGISVNVIRDRLEKIGELIHVAPRLGARGSILFDFIVTTQSPETRFTPWRNDGLTWTVYAPGTPTAEEPTRPTEAAPESPKANENSTEEEKPDKIIPVPNIPPPPISQPSNVVRVDLSKLDELMRIVGELSITRARLEEQITRLQEGVTLAENREHSWITQVRSLQELELTFKRQLRDLRAGVMRIRLVSIGEVFTRMQFVVRDLMRESQKDIILHLSGQDTEIDKLVVERMTEPLLHLVRNAISHGIEPPAERLAQGKPAQGCIFLSAATAGETIEIEIRDDGQGMDIPALLQQGRQQNLIPESNNTDPYTSALEILCRPGFSTKTAADKISGRGVGMTIVKNTIQELGGSLSLQTQLHQGTCFKIRLPLTLAIADVLIVAVADQLYAIPQTNVREILELSPETIVSLENNELIPYRVAQSESLQERVIPLVYLSQLFGLPSTPCSHPFLRVAIIGNELHPLAVVVDQIIGQREIVVRSISDPLLQIPGIAGATELGDGRIILILDIETRYREVGTKGKGED